MGSNNNNSWLDPGSPAQEELQLLRNSSNNKLFSDINNNNSSNNSKIFYVISNNSKLCCTNRLFCIINSSKLGNKTAMTKEVEEDMAANNNLACNGHRKENRIHWIDF